MELEKIFSLNDSSENDTIEDFCKMVHGIWEDYLTKDCSECPFSKICNGQATDLKSFVDGLLKDTFQSNSEE